ncbi:MAG TPA: hypothetical protein VFV35_03190, partial [Acidimicrobiales bacterium]|nr:hypothetical protein [Acidimicrobiales bacterium]
VVVDVDDDDDRSRVASAALAAAGDPRTSTPEGNRRNLMTAEERNEQLRRLSRSDVDLGPSPWDDGAAPTGGDAELPSRRFTLRVALFLLLLLAVLGAGAGAVWWYATSSYFVGLDDGRVAIFKGRPGGLLFLEPEVVEVTDLTEAAVAPADAAAVEDGHEVGSLAAAERYVRNLRRDAELLSPTTTVQGTAPSSTTTSTTP